MFDEKFIKGFVFLESMSDIYSGIKEFKRRGGTIVKQFSIHDIKPLSGVIYETSSKKPVIVINAFYPLEEKIKTIIHEFLHLSPKYIPYYGHGKSNRYVEECIDSDVELVYKTSPILVDYLKKKYSQAKVYPFICKHDDLLRDVNQGKYNIF